MDLTNEPNFERYALALIYEGREVFTSRGKGLEPLIDCIAACRGRYRGCTLHDRVFGLAAARLLADTDMEMVRTLMTGVVSQPALSFLEDRGIEVTAGLVVKNILIGDRSAVCPGELIAAETKDPETFVRRIMKMVEE